ncbi:MAG TPA: hypothetical protein P5556_02810 [Candidatus Gastranaerophilales bacterium]|nr:hypothetical protein [Candidatus Gastranaerophilales bacterium]
MIIFSAALFLFGQGLYFANNSFIFKPDKVIFVRFKEVPPLIKLAGDVSVYYRGYKVGKATCKSLSGDQQYILFCLDINYKNLKLPTNTKVILKTQDVFGDRYFDLIYPVNPSGELLKNGDMIEGTAVYERVDKYLVEQMESGELGALISNLNYLTGKAKKLLAGENKLSGDVSKSVEDLSYITKELKIILSDPQVKNDIKTTISYMPESLKNLSALLAEEELKKTVKQAPKLINTTVTALEGINQTLPQINQNLKETNVHLPQVNCTLYNTNQKLDGLNQKIPVIPEELINQTGSTLKRYDCIGEALSKTMSKNCLFFRFLFGNPGKDFKDCVDIPE